MCYKLQKEITSPVSGESLGSVAIKNNKKNARIARTDLLYMLYIALDSQEKRQRIYV